MPEDTSGFPHLFSPFTLRNVQLRNRIVFQPHFTSLTGLDGLPTAEYMAYHLARAQGGAGLIIDGHMAVMPEGKMCSRFIEAWDTRVVTPYRQLTGQVHDAGARIFGQLTHCGHTSLDDPPRTTWAPTQMPEPYTDFSTMAMTARDIARTVDSFAASAANLRAGGFDGVEIKVGHDGLLRSFISPYFNRRTDQYGGSLENRIRLVMEVISAIKEATDPDFTLGVRLCLAEYTPFGYDLEYGVSVARQLAGSGHVDYFNCDAGTFSSLAMEIPPAAVEQGFFRPLFRRLRAEVDIPIIAFGRIKTPDLGEQVLAAGEADLIGMARQLIADPDTPRKWASGRTNEVRACIGCNDACNRQSAYQKAIRCVQNPAAGQELTISETRFRRPTRPGRVVIVGGGPAGMKVAEIAALRGHEVTLFEQHEQLGGQVRLAARQPYHEEIAEVTAYLEGAIHRAGVQVWLNVTAGAADLLEMDADVIIAATGSEPDLPRRSADPADPKPGTVRGLHAGPSVPGLDLPCVASVDEVLAGTSYPASRVLVVDGTGHWEAAGTAEFLAHRGHTVTITSRRAAVGAELEKSNAELFLQRARQTGIRILPWTELKQVQTEQLELLDVLSGESYWSSDFDLVVAAYPRRSRDGLYLGLLEAAAEHSGGSPRVERIGDAAAPRLIETTLLEAHLLGATL